MSEEQLKTLNDLTPASEFHRNKFSVRNGQIKLYEDKDLRQAAIEWIKYIQREKEENNKKYKTFYVINTIIYDAKIRVLMVFFNLTEDDLR